MVQLAAIIEKPRECRTCQKLNPDSYLEIEAAIVVVRKADPHPEGGSIFIHRACFCSMKCFQKYVYESYKRGSKGRVGGWGTQKI